VQLTGLTCDGTSPVKWLAVKEVERGTARVGLGIFIVLLPCNNGITGQVGGMIMAWRIGVKHFRGNLRLN